MREREKEGGGVGREREREIQKEEVSREKNRDCGGDLNRLVCENGVEL